MNNHSNRSKQSDTNRLVCLFNILYKTHKSAIYGYICYLTRNKLEAEDLFQETWLRVVKNLHQVNDVKKAKAWLYTIATNLYKDHLRKKKTKQNFWEKIKMGYSAGNPRNLLTNSAPVEEIELQETGQAIVDAVNKLPEKLRRIFILKQMQDFSYLEISDILKMPEGTAKSRMHRAVRILRQELAGFNPVHIPHKRGFYEV